MTHTIKNHADLLYFNTMRLACTADKLIQINNESEIESIFREYQHSNLPTFILSGGSNVVLPSKLHAIVIHPRLKGLKTIEDTQNHIEIEVMGGENWHDLVTNTVNNGWYGLENLALIPGLVGAAPVQNIGAYGVQLEDVLTRVKAFHIPTLKWYEFNSSECQFDYRDSKFKKEPGQWLITRVSFRLHKDSLKINTNYGDVSSLALELAQKDSREKASPADVMNAIINIRLSKLPDPNKLPNCGSFFKNPIISKDKFVALKADNPNIVGYPVSENKVKLAAGWLIDNAGLKGDGIAPILTHEKQALVLVNHGKTGDSKPASQTDILATQQFIQQTIQNKFDVILEREPVWVDSDLSYNR